MSIFITSIGATDNEVCAPISRSILNIMDTEEFNFRGIPAVESSILIRHNQICFTLNCCQLKTAPLTLSFAESSHLIDFYRKNHTIADTVQSQVKEKLRELEHLVSNQCGHNNNCACCVVDNE